MSFNNWSLLAANVKPALQQIVTETTLEIRDGVQANAPVETGFLRDSCYAVTPDGNSTYGEASPPTDDVYLLEEVTPEDDTTGIVGVAADYGIFVELGHHTRGGGSYVPAQPFFYPAVEAGRAQFEENLSQFEGLLAGGL